MPRQTVSNHEQDLNFVHEVLGGNSSAAEALRDRYQGRLVVFLCARGASVTEAEDLVADLWSDCFAAPANGQTLLQKYQGRCALGSWLLTVATNRLIDLKRRHNFRVEVAAANRSAEDFFDRRPQPESLPREESLQKLLRRAVQHAFSEADAESVLMLKLVHLHRLTQREIAQMWGCHESKISRALDVTREKMRSDVLAGLKQADPLLDLHWEDFLELCVGSAGALFFESQDE